MVHRTAVALVLASTLAGCGASDDRIHAAAGKRLLTQSNAVAARLQQHDGCEAARAARSLRRSAETSIANGDVPVTLVGELRDRIVRLTSSIKCVPPPPAPREDERAQNAGRGESNGRGKGEGRGKGDGKRGDGQGARNGGADD